MISDKIDSVVREGSKYLIAVALGIGLAVFFVPGKPLPNEQYEEELKQWKEAYETAITAAILWKSIATDEAEKNKIYINQIDGLRVELSKYKQENTKLINDVKKMSNSALRDSIINHYR